jgi:hypothetical protein
MDDDGGNLSHFVQGRNQWLVVLNEAIKIWMPLKAGNLIQTNNNAQFLDTKV